MQSAAITVIELGYGGVWNLLPDVVDVHQHLLALLRVTVFGIVFAFLIESSEEMSRFMSHRAVGDQRDSLFGICGAVCGSPSVRHFPNQKERQRGP